MKSLMVRLYLAAALVSLAVLGQTTSTRAQENPNVPADRLERLCEARRLA